MNDTIAAVSTGTSAGGIGIVRISGQKSRDILSRIFKCGRNINEIESHTINYGHIIGKDGVIDEVMVSLMNGPKTYTREDVAEINCHGGIKCVQAVLNEVIKNGARLAEPGEFTKRAFLNGRIDLSRAEAVMDLITAKTEASRKAAADRLKGNLYNTIKNMHDRILLMLAHIEASIDYPEHELEQMNLLQIYDESGALLKEIYKLIKNADKGKILRDGLNTVILGKPNVGKSSLLNALLNEERAIVTDFAGTTRDIIQEYIDIGIPLKIADTAGIRETEDAIEKIGIKKSMETAEEAELILLVIDGSLPLNEEDIELLRFTENRKAIVILNKSDLDTGVEIEDILKYIEKDYILQLSAINGKGLEGLYNKIRVMFFSGELNINDEIMITGIRQKNSLTAAAEALEAVISTIDLGFTEDLAAMDLQRAYGHLGEITGESVSEDLIDKIFSEFCLGK